MNSAHGAAKEQRQMMMKTDGKTGEVTYRYAYGHRNRFINWLWHLRYGKNGERITAKEAAKFLPQ